MSQTSNSLAQGFVVVAVLEDRTATGNRFAVPVLIFRTVTLLQLTDKLKIRNVNKKRFKKGMLMFYLTCFLCRWIVTPAQCHPNLHPNKINVFFSIYYRFMNVRS